MADDVFKVRMVRVLPGHDNVLPPNQPIQEEDDPETLVLHQCFPYVMLWPKSQIRLGARGNTPKATTPEVPARSNTPKTTPPEVPARSHGKTAAPPLPSPPRNVVHHDHDFQMAQDPADYDNNYDFLEDLDDAHFRPDPRAVEEPTYLSTEARIEAGQPSEAHRKRLFGSQDNMPPDAGPFTEPDRKSVV